MCEHTFVQIGGLVYCEKCGQIDINTLLRGERKEKACAECRIIPVYKR